MQSGSPRVLEVVRAAFGLSELLLPNIVAEHILGHRADPRERVFIRILGARHLIQAAVLFPVTGVAGHRLGALVDAIHATTMLVVAVKDPQRKVAATVNATAAAIFAAGELA